MHYIINKVEEKNKMKLIPIFVLGLFSIILGIYLGWMVVRAHIIPEARIESLDASELVFTLASPQTINMCSEGLEIVSGPNPCE